MKILSRKKFEKILEDAEGSAWRRGRSEGVDVGREEERRKLLQEQKTQKEKDELLSHFPKGTRFQYLGIEHLSIGINNYGALCGQYINKNREVAERSFSYGMLPVLLKENPELLETNEEV